MRAALPAIRDALEPARFEAITAPRRPALSIVFSGIAPALSAMERGIARSLSSRLTSHLSHNVPMQQLLWDEYVGLLLDANSVQPMAIIVEDLGTLDASSFAILHRLLRPDAAGGPDIVIGHRDGDLPERPAMDERGLVWDIGRVDLQHSLRVLRRLPHRAERSLVAAPCRCASELDPWDDSPDRQVELLLSRAPSELNRAELDSIAPAIRDVFAMFAFDTALHLSLAVLDGRLPLSAGHRAALCGIAALSAHNRQFFSRGNLRLARFLLDTYREALAHETDPELRVSLYYRIAVTCCRRLGDLAGARHAIDQGLAELARAELGVLDGRLQETWLRNIDAMVRVRAGDVAAAFACCERGYDALAGIGAPNEVAAAEVALSRLVIGENALTLASMTGDEPLRDRWLGLTRAEFERWPSLDVVDAIELQRAHIDRLEPARAREQGVIALERARTQLNPLLEHFLLVGLSDLAFRMADHVAAAEYGEQARVLAEELGDVNQTQLALELRAAELAELLGRTEHAERALQDLIESQASSAPVQVELRGRLAQLHARRGEREQALERVAQIIDLAADTGELDLLVRASCFAGEVAWVLGMVEDARAAYASCFELLGAAPASTPAREILRLRGVVGAARLDVPDPEQLAAAIARLPQLMVDERDAWPLARALVEVIPGGPLAPELAAALRTVSAALAACAEPGRLGAASSTVDHG